MDISELAPNKANPRKITDPKLKMLEKSLAEFGSLDGFVFNTNTHRLVGGHQRQKVFKKAKVTKFKGSPYGYVEWKGERFPYREVNWPEAKEKAANIAANKGGGEWDTEQLTKWFQELQALNYDLELTGFDLSEIGTLNAEFAVSETVLPDLPDGDKSQFEQVTFILSGEQAEQVKAAVALAKSLGDFDSENENSNGNGLARVCETYLTEHGDC